MKINDLKQKFILTNELNFFSKHIEKYRKTFIICLAKPKLRPNFKVLLKAV